MKNRNYFKNIFLAFLGIVCINESLISQTCDINYQYRTPIVLKNTGVALTNYQVKLTINTATLVVAGKMQASGNDIRFTDTLCNQLSYFIESGMNTASTVIWVKVPSITAATNRTINMFYANPSASAASDASAVFDLYDDFLGSSLNSSLWNSAASSSTISVGSGAVTLSGPNVYIQSKSSYAMPNIMEWKINSYLNAYEGVAVMPNGTFQDGMAMMTTGGTNSYVGNTLNGGCAYSTFYLSNFANNSSAGLWGMTWIATNNLLVNWPSASQSITSTPTMPGTAQAVLHILCGSSASITADWARVRKYAAVVPVPTLGAEVVNYLIRLNNLSDAPSYTNITNWCSGSNVFAIIEMRGRMGNPGRLRLQMSDASGSFASPKVLTRYSFPFFASDFYWNLNGNLDSGSTLIPNVPYGTGYRFRYTVEGLNYTGPISVNSYTLGAKPVPNYTINNAAQCNETDNFKFSNTGTIGAGNTATHNWSFGDTTFATGSPVSHGYAWHGTKNVKLVSINSQLPQCKDSITKQITVYAQPQANFYEQQACQQYDHYFSDQTLAATGFVNGWNWNFGDATTSTQQNPVKNYAAPGTYTVTLIAKTNEGCKDTVSKTHLALYKPVVKWTVGLACDGEKVQFTNLTTLNTLGSNNISQFNWFFGDGGISLEKNPAYLYSGPGTYYVKLIAYTDYSCQDTFSGYVTVNPKPKASFTAGNVCLNSLVPIKNLSTLSGGILSYGWNFGNGTSMGNIPVPSLTYNQAGTYTIKLIATSGPGCKDSVSKDVTIYNKAVAGFTVNDVCEGTASSFINTSTNASTFSWNFDGQGTDNAQNPLFTFTGASIHPVTLISSSVNGCKDTVKRNALVNPNPTVSFTKSSNAACLNGNAFTFTNTSSIGSGTMAHNWNFGNGGSSTDLSPSTNYLNPGTFTIKLNTMSNKGCSGSASSTVTVHPQTKVDFVGTDVCRTTATTFANKSSVSSGTFSNSWNFGDGNTSNSVSSSNTYANAGTYSVKLTTTTNNGCIDSVRKSFMVHPLPVVSFTGSTVCLGGATKFDNTTTISNGFITNSNWAFGDGGLSTDINPIHTYATSGTFNVTLNVKSDKGCVGNSANNVQINPVPKASFTVISDGCMGSTALFTNTSSGTVAVNSWDFGDGKTSILTSPSNKYAAVGVYKVTLDIESDKGCKSSASKTVEMFPKPKADFSVSTSRTPITKPEITFQDISLNGDLSDWDFGNGTTSRMPFEIMKYTKVGKFKVTLISKTNHGCSDTTSKEVEITNDFRIFFPNSFTPDGNSLNEGFGAIGILNGITTYSMVISSQNGGIMFSSTDISKKWNGKINNTGAEAPAGNYAYFVKFKDYNGKEYNKNGIITLVK